MKKSAWSRAGFLGKVASDMLGGTLEQPYVFFGRGVWRDDMRSNLLHTENNQTCNE